MTQLVKPFAIMIAAAIITSISMPATAAVKHDFRYKKVETKAVPEALFTLELKPLATGERIYVSIKNPGKKNLCVSLNGPDGSSIDNFFSGKKCDEINKVYNFSSADAGVYTLEVRHGAEKITRQIKLEHASVQTVKKITVE